VKIKALLDPESNREAEPLKRSIADVIVADKAGNKYIHLKTHHLMLS
jgi:hypothetical protein